MLSPTQATAHGAPTSAPTPLAYLQTGQGHHPRYHPSQACHRRAEPSQQHSDSYDCYCKPKKKIEKSPGIKELPGHPDRLDYSPRGGGRQSSNVPAPGRWHSDSACPGTPMGIVPTGQ